MKVLIKSLIENAIALILCAFTFLICGCAQLSPKMVQSDINTNAIADNFETLRIGDRIRLIFLDIPTPPPAVEQVIPEDGKLILHMGVEYNFAGKNKNKAEQEIGDIYVNDRRIYKRLTVIIEKQATFVSIGGEVRSPSSIVHRGDLTVLSAIDAAGGFTEFANRSNVIVTRASNKKQIVVNVKKAIDDPKLNVILYPGDSVYVKRSRI